MTYVVPPISMIESWRRHALAVVACRIDSSPEMRAFAWRFLRQHGAKPEQDETLGEPA